jgi:hypothetical protein
MDGNLSGGEFFAAGFEADGVFRLVLAVFLEASFCLFVRFLLVYVFPTILGAGVLLDHVQGFGFALVGHTAKNLSG